MPSSASSPKHRIPPDRLIPAILLAAGAIALALRAVSLGSKGIWMDEAYAIHLARLPFATLIEKLSLESTPPLYNLLLGVWIDVFGAGALAVRSLSTLFSVAGVALIGLLAARFFSFRAAAFATALLAFTPLHVYYAQEARMYSLLALLGTALVLFALDYQGRRATRSLVGAAVVSLAMLFTHTVAIWLIAGVNIAFLVGCRDRPVLLRWIAAQAAVGVCYLPWLVVLLKQVGAQQVVLEWFVYIWESKSIPAHVMDSVGGFTLGGYPNYFAIEDKIPAADWVRGAALLLVGWGVIRNRRSPGLRFVATTLLVTAALSLAYSQLLQPVHIPGRTDHALLPLFALLLALGMDAIRPKAVGVLVAVGWIAASLVILLPYYDYDEKSASRSYLAAIQPRSGDVIITTGKTYAETEYYVDAWQLPVTLLSFPRQAREHPGYLNYDELRGTPGLLDSDADWIVQKCRRTLRAGNRAIVILVRPYEVNSIVVSHLRRAFGPEVELTKEQHRQSLLAHPVHLLAFESKRP